MVWCGQEMLMDMDIEHIYDLALSVLGSGVLSLEFWVSSLLDTYRIPEIRDKFSFVRDYNFIF